MTEEEKKEIIKGLFTSPDFLGALETYLEIYEKVNNKYENLVTLSFSMFCEGYLSCLNYMDIKDKVHLI
jgi:hypothetical protein